MESIPKNPDTSGNRVQTQDIMATQSANTLVVSNALKPQAKLLNKNPTNLLFRLIERAMQQSDDLVLVLEYLGKDGSRTRRVVSPIRFVGTDRFLALCLAREEPRQFYFSQCKSARIDLAMNYVMPVALETF